MTASTSTRSASAATDEDIMAAHENRILVSAETDFGELLATAPVIAPSVI